jgi:hypothetical protein
MMHLLHTIVEKIQWGELFYISQFQAYAIIFEKCFFPQFDKLYFFYLTPQEYFTGFT